MESFLFALLPTLYILAGAILVVFLLLLLLRLVRAVDKIAVSLEKMAKK